MSWCWAVGAGETVKVIMEVFVVIAIASVTEQKYEYVPAAFFVITI